MPKIAYKDIQIRRSGLAIIEQVNDIISVYQSQGYSLTLRQAYYQLVSRNVIPNSEKSYDNLGNLISNGRLAGLIDWNAIEDRTRYLRSLSHWDSPKSILDSAAHSYRRDMWLDQDYYIEVWVEKDALVGIIEQAAERLDVPCLSCRGYTSQSEMWAAAQRIIRKNRSGKEAIILHLGDHDPSGIDMTRDITERLNMFGADVEIQRIALNMPQIKKYNPPPNPAKLSDSRSGAYVAEHGYSSWELDALEPRVLDDLITTHIKEYLNQEKFDAIKARVDEERQQILDIRL